MFPVRVFFSMWKIINTVGMLILTGGACVRTVPVCWLWFELVIAEPSDFDVLSDHWKAYYTQSQPIWGFLCALRWLTLIQGIQLRDFGVPSDDLLLFKVSNYGILVCLEMTYSYSRYPITGFWCTLRWLTLIQGIQLRDFGVPWDDLLLFKVSNYGILVCLEMTYSYSRYPITGFWCTFRWLMLIRSIWLFDLCVLPVNFSLY